MRCDETYDCEIVYDTWAPAEPVARAFLVLWKGGRYRNDIYYIYEELIGRGEICMVYTIHVLRQPTRASSTPRFRPDLCTTVPITRTEW